MVCASERELPNVATGTYVEGWSTPKDGDRIALVRQQVYRALQPSDYPSVLFTARSIVAQCPSRDDACELNAIFHAVQSGPIPVRLDDGQIISAPGLRFVTEARFTDSYPSAKQTLDWLATGANGEDCDGHVILAESLLMVLGWLPGCVIASQNGREFVHIFGVVGWPKENPVWWVPLDTTVPGVNHPLWWPPRNVVPRMRLYGLMPDGPIRGVEI